MCIKTSCSTLVLVTDGKHFYTLTEVHDSQDDTKLQMTSMHKVTKKKFQLEEHRVIWENEFETLFEVYVKHLTSLCGVLVTFCKDYTHKLLFFL